MELERLKEVRRKLVIVGDGACGKTSLLSTFSQGTFPDSYVPTVFENSVVSVRIDGQPIELELWDTAGQEEYDQLRRFSYANADVVLIAFSIESSQSLENAQGKWISEVLSHCPDVPILLVGLKTDLRTTHSKHITKEQGTTVSVNLTAMYMSQSRLEKYRNMNPNNYTYPYLYSIKYVECSSKLNQSVHDVFEHATRAALAFGNVKNNISGTTCCIIL